jgi:pyruvate dehydrogenase E1 component
MIPFFLFYSMFGFQRIGDLIWQNADARGKGFLIGATAGRTTLAGEGLQHQDGHSHVLASTVPTIRAYDPAYAYEIAVIVQDGLRRMYGEGEDCFYYLTVENEMYSMPPMPDGAAEGIRRGLYRLPAATPRSNEARVNLFGSGAILNEALRALELLTHYEVHADVWSVTSYSELRRDGLEVERWNLLHPTEPPRVPYLTQVLADSPGPVVAASDYMKAVPDQVARFVPAGLTTLGTDGFGRSDTRQALRRFFEVDAEHIAVAALYQLSRRGEIESELVQRAIDDFGIDPERKSAARS